MDVWRAFNEWIPPRLLIQKGCMRMCVCVSSPVGMRTYMHARTAYWMDVKMSFESVVVIFIALTVQKGKFLWCNRAHLIRLRKMNVCSAN